LFFQRRKQKKHGFKSTSFILKTSNNIVGIPDNLKVEVLISSNFGGWLPCYQIQQKESKIKEA